MPELLKPFWGATVKYSLIVGGILLVLFKVRQSGKDSVERKQAMETLKGVQQRDKIEDIVTSANDTERAKLRKKWQRD